MSKRAYPLLISLSIVLHEGYADIRHSVVAKGTTVPPGFLRSESKCKHELTILSKSLNTWLHYRYCISVMEECPIDYPYSFDGGMRCCAFVIKNDNTILSSNCDGGHLTRESHALCCYGQSFVACKDQIRGCRDSKGIGFVWWTSLLDTLLHDAGISACSKTTPTIVHSDPSHESGLFPVSHVFSIKKCESKIPESNIDYLLFPNHATNQKFVIDLGCVLPIKQFVLKNTKNGYHKDR